MADRVRGDLVAAAVKSVHVFDASANLLGRAAKADAGITPPLVRTFIDAPPAVGDEIAPADEEGEVNSVAVPVQLGSEIRELLPTLELGAIVERHDNELRRAIDAGPRINRRAEQKSRWCDPKSTVSHRRSVRRAAALVDDDAAIPHNLRSAVAAGECSEQRRRVGERGDAEAPSSDAGR